MIWSEYLPTFLMQMFGPAVQLRESQTNVAPEPFGGWVPAHPNEEPPF